MPASVRQRQSLTQMSGAALVNVCVVDRPRRSPEFPPTKALQIAPQL